MDGNVGVVVCSHVFKKTQPILLVVREKNLQFLCGLEHDEKERPHLVGVGHLLERDKSLLEVVDLPEYWEAERVDTSSSWVKVKIDGP
jgi:hypothetical protein